MVFLPGYLSNLVYSNGSVLGFIRVESMKLKKSVYGVFLALQLIHGNAYAEITATDILNILVEEGVLSEGKATALVEKARERSIRETQIDSSIEDSSIVRVPYIPDHVKAEIGSAVKQEVIGDLRDSVVAQAKQEGWGIAEAPEWVQRINVSGDVRVRYQGEFYASDNPGGVIFDINEINDSGGVTQAGRNAFVNTENDRNRLRGRARVKLTAKPAEGVEVGLRIVTGNEGNPVSSNKTLGNFGQKWESNFDLAYIKYGTSRDYLTLEAGRFENPMLHTDLVWDSDMTFEGVSASFYPLNLMANEHTWNPFVTLGVFPLQEIHQRFGVGLNLPEQNDDKWLFAGQIGSHFELNETNHLDFGIAYYYFDNVVGQDNPVNQSINNVTASPFYQFGNTLQNIVVTDDVGGPLEELFALASEFEPLNITLAYRYTGFEKHRVDFSADWVRNLAFDREEVADRIGANFEVPDRDSGYQLGFRFGTHALSRWGDWNAGFKYRYLEGDAVLDAFADSDFLVGGTNAKGYIADANMALTNNVFITLTWISSEEIDAADVFDLNGNAIASDVELDTVQLDINAKF